MSGEVLVEVDNVSKKFCRDLKRSLWYGVKDLSGELTGRTQHDALREGEFWAVKDVSFQVRRGEVLGLIGPNGAGKSTLLRILNGLIKPDRGKIIIRGRVGALIALGTGFNPILTGRENVYNAGAVLGLKKKEIEDRYESIVKFSELEEFMESPVRSYSSGMKIRLGFAIAAQMQPDVLILDEVLALGDVAFKAKSFNRIYSMTEHAAVILVSHSMAQISRVATKTLVIRNGKQAFYGASVGEGISEYYKDAPNKLPANDFVSDLARIDRVEIEINGQQGLETVRSLDHVAIKILARIDGSVDRFSLNIVFFSEELINFMSCNSFFDGVTFLNSNCSNEIVLEIRNLNLNPGRYYVWIAVLRNDFGEILARNASAGMINIVGPHKGNEPVRLKGQWTHKQV